MKQAFRIFIIAIIIILLVVGSALAVGIFKPRAYEGMLNKLVNKKTGYEYSTTNMSIQLSPTIITIEGLKLNNPNWVDDPSLLELGNAVITLNLKQLFNKQLPFWSAALMGLDVKFLENDEGQINWNTSILARQSKKTGQENGQRINFKDLLSFSSISIDQAKLRQVNPGRNEKIDISSLFIERVSDVSIELKGAGIIQEQNVDIDGSIDIDNQNTKEQHLRFAMKAQGLGIDLQSKGKVNPLDLEGAQVSLKAKSDNLEKLEAFLKTTFPDVAPVDITLDLLSSNGSYKVSQINLQMGENVLTGDVLFKEKASFLSVNLASEKINLAPFMSVQMKKEAEVAEVEDSTEVEMDWSWMESLNSELTLDIGEIIAKEHKVKDVSAVLKIKDNILEVDDISARYRLQSAENPGQSFDSDVIKISGFVKPLENKTYGNDVNIDISITDNNSSLAIEGDVNINGIEDSALSLDADLNNLDTLSKYLHTDFSPYLPAIVGVNFEVAKNSINLEELKVTSKDSDLSGDINVDWSGEKINVEGDLESNLLDLSLLLIESEDGLTQKNKSKQEKIFNDEEIDWAWLDKYDTNLELDINKLIAKENVFYKVKTKIDIGNGSLSIKPLQALFADGSIKTVVTLKKTGDSVNLNAQVDAINLGLAAMGIASDSVLEGGTTDVVLDFSGQGNSLHQIMSSLDGEMVAEVQKGIIKNDAFEAIGTDIVLEMMSMLNPFMKEDETTELECAAVKFIAEDGVFTSKNQLAVETSKMKIVGGGIINMNTEELEIGFSPSAKKGIGVNVGSLVKFVRLGGTLRNPHPEADPVGLLKSGAAIGAAVSTGGLSLLVEGLFKRATSAGSACNQALQSDFIDDADSDGSESFDANSNMQNDTEGPK